MKIKQKLGLITLFEENYGSILQCFSTKTFVESLGYECDLLVHPEDDSALFHKIKKKIAKTVKVLLYPSLLFYVLRKKFRRKSQCLSFSTKKKMDDFIDFYLKPQKTRSSDLKNEKWIAQYKFFITGSDQVWKTEGDVNTFRFLDFSPKDKRLSLAVSFGTSDIPAYSRMKVKKLLYGFDKIAVREETGVAIVKKYSNADVLRIADPTFIYSGEEWAEFMHLEDHPSKFILLHFLNEPNPTALESINWLACNTNLPIIAVGYNYGKFLKNNNFSFVDGSPVDYLSLIKNAEFVLTDSFHTSLFSINFEKKFFVFNRQYASLSQSSRLTDLLKRFDIYNRLISQKNDLKDLIKTELPQSIREIIDQEREAIRLYLTKTIDGV